MPLFFVVTVLTKLITKIVYFLSKTVTTYGKCYKVATITIIHILYIVATFSIFLTEHAVD